MSTKRQVEAKLAELVRRLDESGDDVTGTLSGSLPDGKVVAISLPDLDAHYWTTMKDGRMSTPRPGLPEEADIRVRCSSEELIDLVDGRRGFLSSYLSGRIRVDASPADLMALRNLA